MANDDHAPSARVRWARLRFQILGTAAGRARRRRRAQGAHRRSSPRARGVTRPPASRSASRSRRSSAGGTSRAAPTTRSPRSRARSLSHAGTHPSSQPRARRGDRAPASRPPALELPAPSRQPRSPSRARTRASGPCRATRRVCRFMKGQGLLRARKRRHREHPDGEPFVARETRSYEVTHVHGLWHLDFHEGSRPVLAADGQWQKPQLLGVLDDRSRLCCHLQWYLEETAEALIHALSQAFQKRGLPRALLTDNGAAMIAAETAEGLERLGIVHHTTLPYSPEQNGKQESFWGQIEGRLLPMLEGEPELSLDAAQHRHPGLGRRGIPAQGALRDSRDSARPLPARPQRRPRKPQLRRPPARVPHRGLAQTAPQRRHRHRRAACASRSPPPTARSRSSDCASPAGTSPASTLVDPRSGDHLATLLPLDKARNAERVRRVVAPAARRRARSAPSASPRTCARSWPTTPPPACPLPTCPNTIDTDDTPEDS